MNDLSGQFTEVIAFASGKGGTGKTSFVAALGYALIYSGHTVLLLDCDRATDGLSLFILGPEGARQVSEFSPENTFHGILESYKRDHKIVARQHVVTRRHGKDGDHGQDYNIIISGKGLYGDSAFLHSPDQEPNQELFRTTVADLFEYLRALHEYDYILVDTRGGFSFESIDVARFGRQHCSDH
jgi:cellulose biosynthesis protein BcsQ